MNLFQISRLLRTSEWWDYKISPAIATAYGAAWISGVPVADLAPRLLLLLAAGILCGAYASLINDVSDVEDDQIARKRTEIMSFSQVKAHLVVAASAVGVAAMSAALFMLQLNVSAVCCLLIALAYTLYSTRPTRLKNRGLWGVMCVATGEHLLAALLSVSLVLEHQHHHSTLSMPFSLTLLAALSVWSTALGVRSIVWHQLCDYDNDRLTGSHTLAVQHGRDAITSIVERVIFPFELLALEALIVLSGNHILWFCTAAYMILEMLRLRYLNLRISIVRPHRRFWFALMEYYNLVLPLSFLLSFCCVNINAWLLSIGHIVLFGSPLVLCSRHITEIIQAVQNERVLRGKACCHFCRRPISTSDIARVTR